MSVWPAIPAVLLVAWAAWQFFGLRGGDPYKGYIRERPSNWWRT